MSYSEEVKNEITDLISQSYSARESFRTLLEHFQKGEKIRKKL